MTRAERCAHLRGIYCIINEGPKDSVALAAGALHGGVRVLQYRAKQGVVPTRLRALCALAHGNGGLLVVNDDWAAALAFDCDGVHLGLEDAGFSHLQHVRAALGERLVGLSCATVAEARIAKPGEVDYVGVGPVFATASKPDAGEPIGLDGLRAVVAATPLPVAAIGGITAENVIAVAHSGAAMAAVISAVADAPDPRAAAKRLVDRWETSV